MISLLKSRDYIKVVAIGTWSPQGNGRSGEFYSTFKVPKSSNILRQAERYDILLCVPNKLVYIICFVYEKQPKKMALTLI